jgi:putative endonuclease
MSYFVYILYSRKCDKYYVGHSESIERRITEHNIGKGGHFSSSCLPWTLAYSESFNSRSEAVKREREIKNKKSRKYIDYLIQTANG